MKKLVIPVAVATIFVMAGISMLTATNNIENNHELYMKRLASETPEEMVLVEGGNFDMGATDGDIDEKPVHKVKLNSYYIDKYEVTTQQFADFLNENGNNKEGDVLWLDIIDDDCPIVFEGGEFAPKEGVAKHPILEISWYGARAYAVWIEKRLPTEAEWEFAARGGNKSQNFKYSGSDELDEVAWFDKNADNDTHPVGMKKPNELGIYDMSGNVWEWCSDWYDEFYYKKGNAANPSGPKEGKYRVLRGGAWVSIDIECRTQARDFGYRHDAFYLNGFRCVKDVE